MALTETAISLHLQQLTNRLKGKLLIDPTSLTIYATDASAYRQLPSAVVLPKTEDDIMELVRFARKHQTSLIPRAAGTSLAGQVVGGGIVVDVSRYMTGIIELNTAEKWVRLQPGVILDELNLFLRKHGLFFGPETSTSNRCMLGGMVGNNACGAHSLIYGSTRDHLLEVRAVLSDGTIATFGDIPTAILREKIILPGIEGRIYAQAIKMLSDKQNRDEIRDEFPDPALKRRNTGYALDILLETDPFTGNGKPFNLSRLIAGSEGTLAFITEIKLSLVPLPPQAKALICVHCPTLEDALQANLIALKHNPGAIELMDRFILDCTRANIEQRKNRFFIDGDPGAILIIEFARDSLEDILKIRDNLVSDLRAGGYGYHFPLVTGTDMGKVWALRKAGLGVLSNLPGDAKPVSVIEDTAVKPELLPAYIADVNALLKELRLECVFHAHVGTGELHLRPVLNLKDEKDVALFRRVATEVARLVKKYRGSLSGEHGDGRLRGEFIPIMVGEKNYQLMKEVKKTWDPDHIFNPGKITDTPPMDTSLRFIPGKATKEVETMFDYSSTLGFMRMVEGCNGSGDCRKPASMGGTMCPSYMATLDEATTTRARANLLRETINASHLRNPFNDKELLNILDLCLSCKGCKSECPSNVDMAKLKAEFLHHYYKSNSIPLRTRLIAHISKIYHLFSHLPVLYNLVMKNRFTARLVNQLIGFARERKLPLLYKYTLRRWLNRHIERLNNALGHDARSVYLFVDEFTNYHDVQVGIATVQLLNRLGYKVLYINHAYSGRTYISKGFLRVARNRAHENIRLFRNLISAATPLVGIEPSAILTFRDEYPDLAGPELKADAERLAKNTLLIDEFIAIEFAKGTIKSSAFTSESKRIKFHGHCQQKAVASTSQTITMLSIPANYHVEEIKSGCCGMAGSFGYEKEHYELSMQIGELVLFPEVRQSPSDTLISALGTSCRSQIDDGTGRKALHPVQILLEAMNK